MTSPALVLIRKYPSNYLDKPGVEEIVRSPCHGKIVTLENDSPEILAKARRILCKDDPLCCGYAIEEIDLDQL
jgi:hypothetical protein